MCYILGCIIGWLGIVFFVDITTFIAGFICGMKLNYARFLVFKIQRDGERYSISACPFVWPCAVDMSPKDDKVSRLNWQYAIVWICELLIVIVLWTICWPDYFFVKDDWSYFFSGVVCAVSVEFVWRISLSVGVLKNKKIMNLLNEKVKLLKAGYSYGELNLSIEEIKRSVEIDPNKDLQNINRLWCCRFYFEQEYDRKNKEGLAQAIFEIERNLTKIYNRYQMAAYETLIFYYSYINFQPQKAKMYYEQTKVDFEDDRDANGLRIRAYYQYFVMNDISATQKCIYEAKEYLYDSKKSAKFAKAERERERKLIGELEELLLAQSKESKWYNNDYIEN